MRTRIKVCGITNLDDALLAVDAGVDALGFVFYGQSPRYIDPESARAIVQELPPLVTAVGVFVNEKIDTVRQIAMHCSLGLLQFHGDESPEYCGWYSQRVLKAFRVKDIASIEVMKKYKVHGYLLDSYSDDAFGGTGRPFDWSLARKLASVRPLVLAGGLAPENVGQAVEAVTPYAVDVSSGVESRPGSKDAGKIRRFVEAVYRADAGLRDPKRKI
jgi:phosphoribosylanthranilate isomerase